MKIYMVTIVRNILSLLHKKMSNFIDFCGVWAYFMWDYCIWWLSLCYIVHTL